MDHVTCLGCGCACDDISVRVEGGRITHAERACELGLTWFGDGTAPAAARVDGREASTDAALDAAAALLIAARRPLVFVAPELSCEAQRAVTAIADGLGAALDSMTSSTAMGAILAAQERGRASATLGEIRHRADLAVFWGVDLDARYPRFRSRYLSPSCMVVHVAASDEAAALEGLRAPLAGARYVVIVADAEGADASRTGRSGALIALTQALNHSTRAALVTLRAGGNRSGADAVMTAHTGYPAAVDYFTGYPRYRPHDGGALARLSHGECDAALVVGDAARISAEILTLLAAVPLAIVGPRGTTGPFAGARAVVDTGIAGIHDEGTALRLDDVALPLRRVLGGPPETAATVRALAARLTKADAVDATARRIGTRRA